ncbi:MAG UNVERIFIED_CONTAM: hypothetical protein LVR18_22685 [Planctomycetaceae bacterium]
MAEGFEESSASETLRGGRPLKRRMAEARAIPSPPIAPSRLLLRAQLVNEQTGQPFLASNSCAKMCSKSAAISAKHLAASGCLGVRCADVPTSNANAAAEVRPRRKSRITTASPQLAAMDSTSRNSPSCLRSKDSKPSGSFVAVAESAAALLSVFVGFIVDLSNVRGVVGGAGRSGIGLLG